MEKRFQEGGGNEKSQENGETGTEVSCARYPSLWEHPIKKRKGVWVHSQKNQESLEIPQGTATLSGKVEGEKKVNGTKGP